VRHQRTNLSEATVRDGERGIVIVLVAVVMLFVVGAMAALSIDVVTLYTARSEAQLAADAAALAGARVLANSGLTSTAAGPAGAEDLARTIATQVAASNQVGGKNLSAAGTCTVGADISVCFNDSASTFITNPHVTVTVQRSDLPTFFARIWGRTQLTVAASATAEAYNPSNIPGVTTGLRPAVAPVCVKPWLLPNIDPTQLPGATTPAIFDPSGAVVNPGLVGQSWPSTNPALNQNGLYARAPGGTPIPGRYYPGAIDATDFPGPTQGLPDCSAGFTPYKLAIAGCVPRPIPCGATATVNIDTAFYPGRNASTVSAAKCLVHYQGAVGDTDGIDPTALPSPPFQFLGGNENPIAGAVGKDVLVSDSLVTIPVYDSSSGATPTNPVTVIGFLQVFLNPQSATMPFVGPSNPNEIPVTIVNMAGCGTGAMGSPILGHGSSPVTVRLISTP
jgi:hypothetical protein